MFTNRFNRLIALTGFAAMLGAGCCSAATSNDGGGQSGKTEAVVRIGTHPALAQRSTTYVRCYFRKSSDPFHLDVRYVWAVDPRTGWFHRLPGEWHGGHQYHWQALFYTDESQGELRSLCEQTLEHRGIAAGLVMYSAGNTALAFDYVAWSTGPSTPGNSIDRVVAFGDSLSDTHNLYNASRRQIPNNDSWYAGRFTNGRNWVEYLAGDLQVPLYDWAVGGVGVSDRRVLPWAEIPGVLSQSRQWRRATRDDPSYDPGRTLFTVLVGGNDLIFFGTPVESILAKERETIGILIDGGARNILVLNLPDVSRAPIFKLKRGSGDVATKVQAINRGLVSMVDSLRQQYGAKLNIQLFDTHALFTRLFDDPGAYGFQNSAESCLDINRTGMSNFMERHAPRPACKDPDSFVFWDILHPTTRTHRILADQVAAFVRQRFMVAGQRNAQAS